MSAAVANASTTWPLVFDGQPTDEVRENRDAAGWLLNDVNKHPSAYHPDLAAMLGEVVDVADQALAARSAVAVDPPIGANLDLIKRRVDVAGYIGRRAPTVRYQRGSRGNLRARCPFPDHDDREPSLSVNPEKAVWRCFGCGRGGDVFTFVMHWDGSSFREAIAELAREAGVDLPRRPDQARVRSGMVRVG